MLGGGLAALTLFASCENFLKSTNVRDEILDVIAYNNAQQCTVVFRAEAGTGEFLGSVERTLHVGYESVVQFELNKADYVFKGLEAVSQNDKETSRADCIEFIEISKDENKGIYKYNVKLIKDSKDVLVRPVCVALPKVLEILPKFESNGCDQDTPIQIVLSKAVNPQNFNPSCISIYSDENLKDYFEQAKLSNDNKSIYIAPVSGKLILPPDQMISIKNIEVNYDFTDLNDEDGVSFTAKGTHSYKINKNFGNQKKITVAVQSNSEYGTFASNGQVECTVGYSIEVQFALNKAQYKFLTFEAVNSQDDSINYNHLIVLEDKEFNEEKGIYKAKIKVLEEQNNILIRPVCMELPAVTGIYPDSSDAQFANMPFSINFNMPIEGDINKARLLYALKLTAFGMDVSNYFETPEFNEDGTSLLITPKTEDYNPGKSLLSFINGLTNVRIIDVNVSFSSDAGIEKQNINLPLKSSTMSVRYKSETDYTPPEEYDFFVTRKSINLQNASEIADDDKFEIEELNLLDVYSNSSKILKNRTNGLIYIYGLYRSNSDVRNITVTEKRIRNIKGEELNDTAVTSIYTKKTPQMKLSSKNGDLYFCIAHQIHQGDDNDRNDGAFLINVTLTSGAGIQAQTKVFTAIKKSYLDFYIDYDHDFNILNGFGISNTYNQDVLFDESSFNNMLKKFSLEIGKWPVQAFGKFYDTVEYKIDNFTFEYRYADKEKDSVQNYESFSLDVDSINGQSIYITATDDLGNSAEKEFVLPSTEGYLYTMTKNGNTASLHFFHSSGGAINRLLLIKYAPDGTVTAKLYNTWNNAPLEIELIEGYNYKVAPCLYLQDPCITFWPGIPDNLKFTYDSDINTLSYEVGLKNVFTNSNGEEYPVLFEPAEKDSMLKGTIYFADNTWSKFDAIYVDVNYPNGIGGYYTERIFLKKNCYNLDFNVYTKSTFENGCSFTVYGLKGASITNGVPCTVPALKTYDPAGWKKYDNVGPYLLQPIQEAEYLEYTIKDDLSGSGPGTITLIKNGKKYEAELDGTDYKIKIPIWDIKACHTKYLDFIAEIFDAKGNKSTLPGNTTSGLKPSIKKVTKNDGTNKWHIEMCDYNDDVWGNTNDFFWNYTDKYNVESKTFENVGGTKTGNDITIPSDSLVKIRRRVPQGEARGYVPAYFIFTGSPSSGDYDLFYQNGSSKTSFAVQSDAPVYIQTRVTDYPYSECKDWTATEWQYYTKHFGEKYYEFSKDIPADTTNNIPAKIGDHTARRYTVPIDEIETGECYCVIALFADNHVEMSEVYQK